MAESRLLELCAPSRTLGWNQGALGSMSMPGRPGPMPAPRKLDGQVAPREGCVLSTQQWGQGDTGIIEST